MNLNMNKYIDTDSLRKEIDHRIDILEDMSIKCAKNDDTEMHAYYHGKAISLQELLSFIDSLQQEQPDFPTTDEQIKEFLATHPKVEVPEKYKTPDFVFKKQEQPSIPDNLDEAARHVYESWMGGTMDDVRRDMVELGRALNARKGGSSETTNDLEEAADKYEQEYFTDATLGEAYIAGAEWAKEQMMNKAVEGEIQMRYSGCLCAKTIRAINEDKFKFGDKVRIIIVKEEK